MIIDQSINVKDYETYLGNKICKSGSNDKNIENRRNQGISAISQIVSMLNQVSLGHYHFGISLILRDSILISKLAFNSEVLEQIDEMYLRKILNVAKSAPKEGLYIECGKVPLKFIAKMRRIMFYWYIITRNEDEFIYKFCAAQKLPPSEHDLVLQLEKDKVDINLQLSESQIKKMTK